MTLHPAWVENEKGRNRLNFEKLCGTPLFCGCVRASRAFRDTDTPPRFLVGVSDTFWHLKGIVIGGSVQGIAHTLHKCTISKTLCRLWTAV